MTVQTDIETALFARAEALVLSPALPVAWPGRDFKRPSTGFLRVTHTPNTNERVFIGSTDPHRMRGLLQIDVFTKKNTGASGATEIAGLVAAHFPADLKLPAGNAVVRITKTPDIVAGIDDDTHRMVPVVISYECFA